MWSFVSNRKNKQWIWLALDIEIKEIVGIYVGERSRQGAAGLWQSLPRSRKLIEKWVSLLRSQFSSLKISCWGAESAGRGSVRRTRLHLWAVFLQKNCFTQPSYRP